MLNTMHQEIWNSCLLIIKDNLSNETYKAFFEPIKAVSVKQNVLTLEVPTMYYYEYIEEHYVDLLKKVIRRELGPDAKLEYSIPNSKTGIGSRFPGEKNARIPENQTAPPPITPPIRDPFIIPGLKPLNIAPQLNKEYSFNNFIEGDCNCLARSAGLAVSEKPGKTPYNPLFLYGASGLGKTHLAQAIGIKVKEENPEKIVLYVNASKFTTQYMDATAASKKHKTNDINNFIHFYQCIDVLIVDDVQEFVNKPGTQDIFFEIFNHLHQRGKQLILTSDKPPAELDEIIKDRLLSRFKWGLPAELQKPGYMTRLEILKNRAYRDGIELPENVLEFVAKNVVDNVRELEGTFISLLAQATLAKKDITLELAQTTIEKLTKQTRRELSIDYIVKAVSDYYRIDEKSMTSNTRKREIVQARHVAMYFAKQLTKTSLKRIGSMLGKKDHATVLYACRTVNNLMETDRRFKMQVEELEAKLTI